MELSSLEPWVGKNSHLAPSWHLYMPYEGTQSLPAGVYSLTQGVQRDHCDAYTHR